MKAYYLAATILFGVFLAPLQKTSASFLENFKKDTYTAINNTPQKWGARQDKRQLQEKIDACRQSDSREFIMRNASPKINLKPNQLRFFSGEYSGSTAEQFLEVEKVYDRIQDIDNKFTEGRTEISPWSSDYWAIRTGITANRYLDKNFPGSTSANTWQEAFDYFNLNPPAQVDPNLHSPAEKYDVLVGDESFTLTHTSWAEGKMYNDEKGDVESWMGICHGWAPASYMEPRPTHTVQVASYKLGSKESVQFKPDDIKALVSLKWAHGINVTADYQSGATRFIGGRCNVKNPEKDAETGRIIDQNCFDLNPGLWHIIITNHVGQTKRPLVIDASYDYEVWNQPLVAYSFSYFNPKTLDYTDKLESATVRLDDAEFIDKFKKYRNNPAATQVVGVTMDIEYVIETSPEGAETDSAENDRTRSAKYHYDLELDDTGRIIGGEWYQNKHPDFIWTPMKDSISVNQEDLYNITDSLVPRIAPTSSKSGVPLRYVLNKILDNFRN